MNSSTDESNSEKTVSLIRRDLSKKNAPKLLEICFLTVKSDTVSFTSENNDIANQSADMSFSPLKQLI